MRRLLSWCWLVGIGAASFAGRAAEPTSPLYISQSNDADPTAPTSQPGGRWYHWLGSDPAVTHLETGLAVDAQKFAGRGQRIALRHPVPVVAVQVKVKRIGVPGPLRWEAGTAWGQDDLGRGEIPAADVSCNYEHFVTCPLRTATVNTVFLRLRAASGRCPDDYYAVYCTWKESHPEKATVHAYDGVKEVGMMYRMLRADPCGDALEADGQPVIEGASMMTRLLTDQPGAGRRQLLRGEEEPYTFVEALVAGHDPRRVGLPWPGLQAEPGEIAMDRHWQIQVAAERSPQVETAVEDLTRLLADSMRLNLKVVWDPKAAPKPHTITLSQGPGLPGGAIRPAGYRFVVGANGVQIHGHDARGVLRGIWHLENLLLLRGGPVLKPDARTREPRFSPRATCATWGGMGELATPAPVYTDGHLSLISHYGYDAIWLGWNPGPERDGDLPTRVAPGRVPEGTTYQPFTSRLRDLTERAERYDIEVMIQLTAPHPDTEADKQALCQQVRQLLRDVPKIKTVVLLDEGMGSVRKGVMAWTDTCSLLTHACWEARPDLNVVAWYYTFRDRTADEAKWEKRMEDFSRLDRRIGYMANFDSFWCRRRNGLLQCAFDYCLSLRAPADDYRFAAKYLAREAQRDGQAARPIWTKIESRFSQECNTLPEIPSMQRWAERFRAVIDFKPPITGLIANWYHQGFYPTPVTELFGWLSYTGEPPVPELLRAMARRDFGPGQEQLVLDAWQDFSEAIWHYPFYFGLSYPMNSGCAQPFWLDPKEANPRPWRRGFVNSAEAMNLGNSGEGPGSGPENRARLAEMWTHWSAGLEKLQRATAAAPAFVRERAADNWRTARAFGNNAEMTLRLIRWFDARERLQKAQTPAERLSAMDALEKIGREELAAARAALPLYLRDSRMGNLNHGRGCFTAQTIINKIDSLQKTLDEDLPRLRAATQ